MSKPRDSKEKGKHCLSAIASRPSSSGKANLQRKISYPRLLLLLLLSILAISTFQSGWASTSDQAKAAAVAENFINSYVQAIPSFDGYMGAVAWVKRSPLASPDFKKRLEDLYRNALREDPEFGYGADAVLGAQDYPDGFKVTSVRIDGNKAIVDLLGTEPFEMKLRMILIRHKDTWLVEASGDLVELQ